MQKLVSSCVILSLLFSMAIGVQAEDVPAPAPVPVAPVASEPAPVAPALSERSDFVLTEKLTLPTFLTFDMTGGAVLGGTATIRPAVTQTNKDGSVTVVSPEEEVVNTKKLYNLESEAYIGFLNNIRADVINTTVDALNSFKPSGNSEDLLPIKDWGILLYTFSADGHSAVADQLNGYFNITVGSDQYALRLTDEGTRQWIDTVLVPWVRNAVYAAGVTHTYNVYAVKSNLSFPLVNSINNASNTVEALLENGFAKEFAYYVHPILGLVRDSKIDTDNIHSVVSLGDNYGYIVDKEYIRICTGELNNAYTGLHQYNGVLPAGMEAIQYISSTTTTVPTQDGTIAEAQTSVLSPKNYVETLADVAVVKHFEKTGDKECVSVLTSADDLLFADNLKYDFISNLFVSLSEEKDSSGNVAERKVTEFGTLKESGSDIQLINLNNTTIALKQAMQEVLKVKEGEFLTTGRAVHIGGTTVHASEPSGVKDVSLSSAYMPDGTANITYDSLSGEFQIELKEVNSNVAKGVTLSTMLQMQKEKEVNGDYSEDSKDKLASLRTLFVTSEISEQDWESYTNPLGLMPKKTGASAGFGKRQLLGIAIILLGGTIFLVLRKGKKNKGNKSQPALTVGADGTVPQEKGVHNAESARKKEMKQKRLAEKKAKKQAIHEAKQAKKAELAKAKEAKKLASKQKEQDDVLNVVEVGVSAEQEETTPLFSMPLPSSDRLEGALQSLYTVPVAPVASEPAPVAPVASEPAPVASEPAPAAPVASEPAPVASEPAPVAPVASEPAPVAPVADKYLGLTVLEVYDDGSRLVQKSYKRPDGSMYSRQVKQVKKGH